MSKNMNLLPCPFCGASNAALGLSDYATCRTCGADGPVRGGAEAWNRRSTSSVSEGEMPELPPLPEKMGTIYPGNYWTGLPTANPPGKPLADFITMGQAKEYARAAIAADRRKQAALQELVDIAQELDMGYGPSSAATKAAATADAKLAEQAEQTAILGSENQCRDLLLGIARRAPAEDAREEVPPFAWVVGADVFKTYDQAVANVRNPELKPEPLYRRATSVPAIPGTVDEAAAYRLWRDCELSEDAWFMQHLSDYLPVGRAPTAAEWDAAMLRVMQDRAANAAEAKAGGEA